MASQLSENLYRENTVQRIYNLEILSVYRRHGCKYLHNYLVFYLSRAVYQLSIQASEIVKNVCSVILLEIAYFLKHILKNQQYHVLGDLTSGISYI